MTIQYKQDAQQYPTRILYQRTSGEPSTVSTRSTITVRSDFRSRNNYVCIPRQLVGSSRQGNLASNDAGEQSAQCSPLLRGLISQSHSPVEVSLQVGDHVLRVQPVDQPAYVPLDQCDRQRNLPCDMYSGSSAVLAILASCVLVLIECSRSESVRMVHSWAGVFDHIFPERHLSTTNLIDSVSVRMSCFGSSEIRSDEPRSRFVPLFNIDRYFFTGPGRGALQVDYVLFALALPIEINSRPTTIK